MTNIAHWIKETHIAIKASDILYDNKEYSSSFRSFQKAIENINKAFAIFIDKYTLKQLKSKIGHEPLKYYDEKIQGSYNNFLIINVLGEKYPQIKENEIFKQMSPGEEYLKTLEVGKKEFEAFLESGVDFSYKDLKDVVARLQYLEKYKIEGEINETELIDRLQEVSNFFRLIGEDKLTQEINKFENSLMNPEQRKIFYEILKYSMDIIPDFIFIFYTFFYCAMITHGHYFKSGYPDDNTTPSDIYTKKHPIVKIQPYLTEMLEEAVFRLEKLIVKTEIIPLSQNTLQSANE